MVYCPGCLVIDGPSFKDDPSFGQIAAKKKEFKEWPLLILVDDVEKALRNSSSFLWTTFTRFEPAADIHSAGEGVKRHHLSYTPPIVIDARLKPSLPKELFCGAQARENVDKRWQEYFPQGMEQGSSDYGHLI